MSWVERDGVKLAATRQGVPTTLCSVAHADTAHLPANLHTFVDESYGRDDYYVGGFVVTTEQLQQAIVSLAQLKADLAQKYGVPVGQEIHAHEIMQGKGGWSSLRGQTHESVWICREVLRIVAASGARVHLQGVDVRRLNARYRYPDSPYRICLRHLLERVHDECAFRSSRSTVTADILDESGAAIAAINGYMQSPTPGYRATRLCHIDPVHYADSATNLGIQLADVVAYVLRRHREVTRAHPAALRASRQLAAVLDPNLKTYRKWLP